MYQSLRSDEGSSHEDTPPNIYDIDSSSVSVPGVHSLNFVAHEDPDDSEYIDDDSKLDSLSQSTFSDSAFTLDESGQFMGLETSNISQAVVFLEDAYYYRSINHKVDTKNLYFYRHFRSSTVLRLRYFFIFLLHILAFFEYPSSLTLTSDPRFRGERVELPCWLTQVVELICLLFLLLDNVAKICLIGPRYFVRNKWDLISMAAIIVSFFDWCVSFGLGCHEYVRFRRVFRPLFILQHSSLMKKIVKSLRNTLPEVASVLALLFLHLFIFTLFGMLVLSTSLDAGDNNSTARGNVTPPASGDDSSGYFGDFLDSLILLLVTLTTANNPDVMMPGYAKNRFVSLFFILYLIIGLYCFMNMLLAVIYNQFRGYFLSSMQNDLLRRRLGVRASFEVLRRRQRLSSDGTLTSSSFIGIGVGGHVIKSVVDQSLLPKYVKDDIRLGLQGRLNRMMSVQQYQELFQSLDKTMVDEHLPHIPWCEHPVWRRIQRFFVHRYFAEYFGMLVSFVNFIFIVVPLVATYRSKLRKDHALLQTVNFTFIIYYFFEQLCKLWAFGWRRYVWDKRNVFDAFVTLLLIIGEVYMCAQFGLPYDRGSIRQENKSNTVWILIRVVNIFILVRLAKVIQYIKAMSLVINVVVELVKNMRAFGGIMVVIFYAFAIVGMELFHDTIEYQPDYVNRTWDCGTYEQLNYWANNFDDFFASLVVLWDVMVVNNWQVFLYVFKDRTSPWSYLFFVVWWILSVVIIMNLFTALVMENFIMKWDRRGQLMSQATAEDSIVAVHLNNDVRAMFRDMLEEPTDNELMSLLTTHQYLLLDR